MLTVEEALALVAKHVAPLAPRRLPLGETAGLVLAEDIVSEVNSPPYDKTMMDGYAVVSGDREPVRRVLEEIGAGTVPRHAVTPGTRRGSRLAWRSEGPTPCTHRTSEVDAIRCGCGKLTPNRDSISAWRVAAVGDWFSTARRCTDRSASLPDRPRYAGQPRPKSQSADGQRI
jgi:hypothetical protein